MALPRPTEEQRAALCAWLTANGIDPNSVPIGSRLSIGVSDGAKVIYYDQYLTEDGHKQIDPADNDRAWMRAATAPCTVDPPAWLRVPGSVS